MALTLMYGLLFPILAWQDDADNHAQYMFGWQGDSLQRAMDQNDCFYDGCGSLKKQAMTEANKCKVRDMVGDNIDGCKSRLKLSRFGLRGGPLTVLKGSIKCRDRSKDAVMSVFRLLGDVIRIPIGYCKTGRFIPFTAIASAATFPVHVVAFRYPHCVFP